MGGTYQHKDGGISIWFPDNWKVTTDEGMLEVTSPDEEVYLHMLVLQDAKSLDAAIEAYVNQLDPLDHTRCQAKFSSFAKRQFWLY